MLGGERSIPRRPGQVSRPDDAQGPPAGQLPSLGPYSRDNLRVGGLDEGIRAWRRSCCLPLTSNPFSPNVLRTAFKGDRKSWLVSRATEPLRQS
jgi:hypothetical protein